MERKTVIKAEGIYKSFGATKALVDVSIEVKEGEVRGLIGENGSGKSTLVSMISGSQKPDSGALIFMGEKYEPSSLVDGRNAGVAILLQEQGTIDGMTVADNIFLGREGSLSRIGSINRKKMLSETKRIFDELGIKGIDPSENVNTLTFEERKLIEAAAAIYIKPRLLIIDETTTALSHDGRELVYRLIKSMKEQGNSVIFISHDLDEMKAVCDTVTILRDGQLVDTLKNDEVTIDQLKSLMIGRDMTGAYYRTDTVESYDENEVVLKAEGLSYGGYVRNVSLALHRGEILGIGGLTECGMHELCKILFGAIKPEAGTVTVTESGHQIKSPENAIKNGIAYIPKDRDKESAFQNTSIKDNIVMISLDRIKKGIFISDRSENRLAKEWAEKMNVKMLSISQMVKELSGGNKQKVVLAKWLANDSTIMIMDCPTRGIDIGVKSVIYRLMEQLKAEGRSIIMVSEELPELIGMADRIITLKNGKKSSEFKRSENVTEHMLIQTMI